jgi:hypothetical protein
MERELDWPSVPLSLPSAAVSSLDALDKLIFNNRGALYEGDIFSILKRSASVVRSFEFARADGAIDCSAEFPPETNFADRFWAMDQRLRVDPTSTKLLLFDVKSKVSQYAGDQIYSTTVGQRRHVAFYIGICAADPSFIELFPNYHQERPATLTPPQTISIQEPSPTLPTTLARPISPPSLSTTRAKASTTATAPLIQLDGRHIAVNSSRISKLPPSTYILDPCNSPYRMPIGYLSEAIQRVRRCARGEGVYVNPWTWVPFPHWKPATTRSNQFLMPAETSEHFTAYKATMEIYRIVKMQGMKLDFVGLQPRLADFKLITQFSHPHARHPRQVFVQHKLDARDRASSTPLTNVAIARGQSGDCRWYFSDIDRFGRRFCFQCSLLTRHQIRFPFLPVQFLQSPGPAADYGIFLSS